MPLQENLRSSLTQKKPREFLFVRGREIMGKESKSEARSYQYIAGASKKTANFFE